MIHLMKVYNSTCDFVTSIDAVPFLDFCYFITVTVTSML